MVVIDCDAHVEESVETWGYLDPAFYRQRPFPVVFPEDTIFGSHNGAWIIDYKMRLYGGTPTLMKRAQEKGASIGAQEITDVEERVAAMAELGVDKQVVFPSLWQGAVAEDVELEAALARSYNEFMAAQCGQSAGRLWYVAVVPFRRPDLAAEEVRRVKELGAGRGDLRPGRRVGHAAEPPVILAHLRGGGAPGPDHHGAYGQRRQPHHQSDAGGHPAAHDGRLPAD